MRPLQRNGATRTCLTPPLHPFGTQSGSQLRTPSQSTRSSPPASNRAPARPTRILRIRSRSRQTFLTRTLNPLRQIEKSRFLRSPHALGFVDLPEELSAHPPSQGGPGSAIPPRRQTVHHRFATRLVEIDRIWSPPRQRRRPGRICCEHSRAGVETEDGGLVSG